MGLISLSQAPTDAMSTPPPRELRPGFFTADMIVRRRVEMGVKAIDGLLGGGLEAGIMHLFYGDRCLHQDLLRFAVKVQMSEKRGGLGKPVIVVDSTNAINIDQLTQYAFELEVEPETAMDRIYITRAFNSSQTYDLVMNQLEAFFSRIPARALMVIGLPELYLQEGLHGRGLQEISHMISKLKNFTLQRDLVTLVTAPSAEKRLCVPAGGKTLTSAAQVHVRVEEHRSYIMYTLAKHPQYPIRSAKRSKDSTPSGIIPLSHFLRGEEGQE